MTTQNVVPIRPADVVCDTPHCPECGYEMPAQGQAVTRADLPMTLRVKCPGCKEFFLWTLENP